MQMGVKCNINSMHNDCLTALLLVYLQMAAKDGANSTAYVFLGPACMVGYIGLKGQET